MGEPLGDNLFDLPDYEDTEDETFPPLPAPSSPGGDGPGWARDSADGNQQSQTKDSAVATRSAPKAPRPKLDAQRLISARGLPALRHMFDNVKFKGKGHEAEDLKTLIQHMEHWAHRLFPKLQFEDFIDSVEALGNKKEVQTCLKRIRLDLPILHEDYQNNEGGEGESTDLAAGAADASGDTKPSPVPSLALTEEQQERMERNRQLALERRQARRHHGHSQALPGAELPSGYSEEQFATPVTQDPTDLTEDTQVPAATAALREDSDGELE
ncbi:TIMELESS-interacting protein isoform X1 [Pithys albifrons albifrons]|uniref:TIMELESS-interacting protein isoform X1 n=1 Tax=Pithys albifrons albifrons TaxID=3385563 RepID=UPI003A5CE741